MKAPEITTVPMKMAPSKKIYKKNMKFSYKFLVKDNLVFEATSTYYTGYTVGQFFIAWGLQVIATL